jgi:hypothetical protein
MLGPEKKTDGNHKPDIPEEKPSNIRCKLLSERVLCSSEP